MSETLAYAAGFLEADGCIQLTGIRVTNRCMDVLDWYEENFGGQVRSKVTPIDCWEWNLHGDAAEKVLNKLYPYLLFKKPQADLFFKYRKTIGSKGTKTSDTILTERNLLKGKLSEEKHKWMHN